MRMLKKVTVIFLLTSMIFVIAAPAMAEADYNINSLPLDNSLKNYDIATTVKTIQDLELYIETNDDGSLKLTKGVGQLASETDIDTSDILEAQRFLQTYINPLILENSNLISEALITDRGIEIIIPDEKVIAELNRLGYSDIVDEVQNDIGILSSGCDGVTKVVFAGALVHIYLSKIVVQSIVVGGGAAVGMLVATIPILGWKLAAAVVVAVTTFVGTQSAFPVVVGTNLTTVTWVLPQCPYFCDCE